MDIYSLSMRIYETTCTTWSGAIEPATKLRSWMVNTLVTTRLKKYTTFTRRSMYPKSSFCKTNNEIFVFLFVWKMFYNILYAVTKS